MAVVFNKAVGRHPHGEAVARLAGVDEAELGNGVQKAELFQLSRALCWRTSSATEFHATEDTLSDPGNAVA